MIFYGFKNSCNMIIPLKRTIRHTEVYFCLFFHVIISSILRYFHSSVEVLSTRIIISFLCEYLTELHIGATLSFSVLEFIWKFQISFYKHLHFILIHLGIYFVTTNFTKITNCNRLSCYTAHLNGISQGKLMIDWGFFIITYHIVNDT